MPRAIYSRGMLCALAAVAFALETLPLPHLQAQEPESAPASVPAGATGALPAAAANAARTVATLPHAKISSKLAHEAQDAYLDGAKRMEKNDFLGADRSFSHAVELNPGRQEYVLALAILREHRVTELVQRAARARLGGDDATADKLLEEARTLDPENSIVAQHLQELPSAAPAVLGPDQLRAAGSSQTLGNAPELKPSSERQSIHRRGASQEVIRGVYEQFGIKATFDPSLTENVPIRLDVDDVDFATAARVLGQMTDTFAVPVQPSVALIAKNTQDNRDRLSPQVEETVYLPGISSEQMNELATLARNIFDLKQVTASPSAGGMLVRGDPSTLKLLNATYADMLDGGSDVLLEVRMYEINKTRTRNIGAQLPSSVGAFSVAAQAQQIVSANQSLINQAIANGVVFPTDPTQRLLAEVVFLVKSGLVSLPQFTNLLGFFGNGLTLAGLYLGSGSTFNFLLNSSEARTLDAVQIRSSSGQPANFRAGTRYPIVTATYSSGVSSSLASQLSGVNVNGTNVGSLLSQYLGSSSVSVPQIQYEDLGITLKSTPRVMRGGDVSLQLEMKIEALGGTAINNIPILNSRVISSTVQIPAGQTALLVSEISQAETRAIQGLPGLSELPGFQGTYKGKDTNYGELLVTITPHVVRTMNMRTSSKRLTAEHTTSTGQP